MIDTVADIGDLRKSSCITSSSFPWNKKSWPENKIHSHEIKIHDHEMTFAVTKFPGAQNFFFFKIVATK
jgi:hypothetical protein